MISQVKTNNVINTSTDTVNASVPQSVLDKSTTKQVVDSDSVASNEDKSKQSAVTSVLNSTKTLTEKAHGAVDNVTNKINDAVGSLTDSLASKMSGLTDNIEGGKKLFETKDIDEIELKNKLVVSCPKFMKAAGVSKMDFGSLFLSPQQQQFLGQIENLANNAISVYNGIEQYLSSDIIIAIQELLTFIMTDLIKTLTAYCTNLMQTYLTPEFPIGLAKDLAQSTVRYTQNNTKKPNEILKEILADPKINGDLVDAERTAKLQNFLNERLAGSLSKTTTKIKQVVDKIEPYANEIARYMKYGPDYAVKQVIQLYKKYLNMGIGIVNKEIGKLQHAVDSFIDETAETAGKYAALKINKTQEAILREAIKIKNKAAAKIRLRASALINRTVMNLMGLLGG